MEWMMITLMVVLVFSSFSVDGSETFVKLLPLSGHHLARHVASVTTQERSKVECAVRCSEQPDCMLYFWDFIRRQCQILNNDFDVSDETNLISGNRLTMFYMKIRASSAGSSATSAAPITCPASEGFVYAAELDYCFKPMLEFVNSWDKAVQGCAGLGLELASLNTDAKITAVQQTILARSALYLSPSQPSYYIGASLPRAKLGVRGLDSYQDFSWLDGSPVNSAMWADGQPNGEGEDHVLALYPPGYFLYDRPSDRTYRYVCQKNP